MTWVIGTDEAGYGPNLGPLVIGASVWHYSGSQPLDVALKKLAQALGTIAEPTPDEGFCIADSKKLYSPARGLARLESCLLAAIAACEMSPRDWRDAWARIAPDSFVHLEAETTYCSKPSHWPIAAAAESLDKLQRRFRVVLDRQQWRLHAVRCRAVFPGAFNEGVRRLGNKAHVLSQTTLELAAAALAELPAEEAVVCCDKHGGRNHYAGVLQHCIPDAWIQPRLESLECSTYECQLDGRMVRFEFRAGGECQPPTALASMAAKYLRELAMQAFNRYWATHVADLKPTAGYPGDAARFHNQVRAAREKLGIAEDAFWRSR